MFEQIEGEAGNAVFVGYSFMLVAEMLGRALIAELYAQLVKIDIDSTMHTGRARNLVKPPLDGTELEIAGIIVEHTPVSQNGTVSTIAQPYLDGFQQLIASFVLGVIKLRLGPPLAKAGLAPDRKSTRLNSSH